MTARARAPDSPLPHEPRHVLSASVKLARPQGLRANRENHNYAMLFFETRILLRTRRVFSSWKIFSGEGATGRASRRYRTARANRPAFAGAPGIARAAAMRPEW